MSDEDQLSYLRRRIAEQRALASSARNADIGAFHARLVDHYTRLLADAQTLSTPFYPARTPDRAIKRPAPDMRQAAGGRKQTGH